MDIIILGEMEIGETTAIFGITIHIGILIIILGV